MKSCLKNTFYPPKIFGGLTPKGFVPNRFKILEYRGKMPLPPIVMEISMINSADY
jgi:hypothetical protein